MAKRKRSAANKIPVHYGDGTVAIEYVPRTPPELRAELSRVQRNIRETIRILSTLKRIRHHVIKSVRFQLDQALHKLPDDAADEDVAAEIARLSYLMEDTLNMLNRLTQCRIANIEKARFKLTYGQTPKKREPPEKYGSRAKKKGTTTNG